MISGPQEFQEAALQAVRQWRYRPYLNGGVPTKVHTIITVNLSSGIKSRRPRPWRKLTPRWQQVRVHRRPNPRRQHTPNLSSV